VLAQRRYRIEYDWATLSGLTALAAVTVLCGVGVQRFGFPYRVGFALLASLLYPLASFAVLHRSRIEHERMQILRDRVVSRLRRMRAA